MKLPILLLALGLFFLAGCQRSIEPINYGKDECYWCQMKIMDPQFGSEAITSKGRTYKFDSAECLLLYLAQSDAEHAHVAVTDFDNPHQLFAADSATFLISEKMPSPMGANLNAFKSAEQAHMYHGKNGGTLYTWPEMLKNYKDR